MPRLGFVGHNTYQVVTTRELCRQLERVRHVDRLHDLVRPLPIHIVLLVDLEPGAHAGSLRCIRDGSEQHVRDGPRVGGRIPLDLDGVAGLRSNGSHPRGDLVAVDVARNVVAGHVRDRVVAWGFPDADFVAWGDIVDPELVEVLVGSCHCCQRGDQNNRNVHFRRTVLLLRLQMVCVVIHGLKRVN